MRGVVLLKVPEHRQILFFFGLERMLIQLDQPVYEGKFKIL